MSFASMVQFIPKYFIIFVAIISGVVFKIPFSGLFIASTIKASDVWMLTLHLK
jgi:hypothetical protein